MGNFSSVLKKQPSICAYCMLHRHQTFKEVISNIRANVSLEEIPFYTFSFRDSYSERRRRTIESEINNLKIKFIKQQMPKFIKEKDLFYNKIHIDYVKTSFPKSRKNYLHMCDFLSDPASTPYINNYDIAVRFDDDSWFKAKIKFDFSSFFNNKDKFIATSHVHTDNILKRRETKIGFFQATIDYCRENKITPKYNLLAKSISTENLELFHQLPWTSGNFNIYKMAFFKTEEWKHWRSYIAKKGGIFTNRWGDLEIIGTFVYIYYKDPIFNLDLYPNQYDQRKDNQSIIYFKKNLIFRILSRLKRKILTVFKLLFIR